MRKISPKVKKQLLKDMYAYGCLRNFVFNDHECKGKITFHHAWTYASKQIDEAWAIIPICCFAHDVNEYQGKGDFDDDMYKWLSLRRATPEDLSKYPKKNWDNEWKRLNEKFGF